MTQAEGPSRKEPEWLAKLRKTGYYVIAAAAGAFLTQSTNLIDGIGKTYDRLFKVPEAFVLAENSAKSVFSDQLAQRAWRRLFWATNFRARVTSLAPLADIDSAWKSYIDADADGNSYLMTSIVGLDRYYGPKRSAQLEGKVQALFSNLDDSLAMLRNSEVVRALRIGREPTDQERLQARNLAEETKHATEAVNIELYHLVRCIAPPTKDDQTASGAVRSSGCQ
jgi:hypothetical protein